MAQSGSTRRIPGNERKLIYSQKGMTELADQQIDCRDERTFQMLYSKLGRPALGKTINIVGVSAAEEIVQDVFVKIWQKQMVFPNLKSAFAWVYKCCTNAAIDYIRNKNNTHSPLLEIDVQDKLNLELRTEARQIWQELIKVFNPDELALFIYRSVEGLSQDEVAEVMQISRRTVNRLQEKTDRKLEKFRSRRHVG